MPRSFACFLWPAAAAAFGLVACGGELLDAPGPVGGGGSSNNGGGPEGGGGGGGGVVQPACDPIDESFCGFPFPSDFNTVDDESTPTGKRVAFVPDGLPVSKDGVKQDPEPWSHADGFSPGSGILAHFPGATDEGLVSVLDLGASLDDAALTVLIDAESGERVLHWAELDHNAEGDDRTLIIHPAVPLTDARRYIVAIRGLVDADGNAIEATGAFAALRDGEDSGDEALEARRPHFDDIFSTLEEHDVAVADLQLAWDFTTASRESNTSWLLHMRDEAFEIVGPSGPTYTITSVDSDLDPTTILYRIRGTMTVPRYLDVVDEPGGALIFGDDGLPEPSEDEPTYEAVWELLIPNIAQSGPVALLQYGHGLLGTESDVESDYFRYFANTFGYAIFSTKWIGLAEEDESWIAARIASGHLDEMTKMFDRLHQGIINNLLVMRMMSVGMDADPTYGNYIDGTRRFYWGISQGGISGGVYLPLSEDVQRGCLEVMGQPYNLLLNRSVDFDPFFAIVNLQFKDPRSQQLFLGLTQMEWDRVEPNGYSKYAFDSPFSGAPAGRRILMRAAVGDHQVSTFGAHIMARAMSAQHLDTGIRDVYGLEKVTAPAIDSDGAVYTEYDFGLPPEPTCNIPLGSCEDPHGKLRRLPEAMLQLNEFFSTGIVNNRCPGYVCDYSAMSGCDGTEDQDLCD